MTFTHGMTAFPFGEPPFGLADGFPITGVGASILAAYNIENKEDDADHRRADDYSREEHHRVPKETRKQSNGGKGDDQVKDDSGP